MIEVLKQARKAFELATTPLAKDRQEVLEAVAAINQAIAELESQEPVATVTSETGNPDVTMSWWHEPALAVGTKLYTHPPQRTWVGLTDKEAQWLYDNCRTPSNLIDMVEAKLKEKNT
jgi:hypothetical protein